MIYINLQKYIHQSSSKQSDFKSIQLHQVDYNAFFYNHFNMEEEKPLQTARQHKTEQIKFGEWIFTLSLNQKNEVLISFSDYNERKSYTCRKVLERIHFQTILVALRKQNQLIVSANMNFADPHKPFLVIRVKHEFLNQFEEKLEFIGENLAKQAIQKYKLLQKANIELNILKKQMIDEVGVCSDSGIKLKCKQKGVQIQINYLFDSTSANLWVNFIGLKENVIKIKLENIDDTGLTIPSDFFPEEGLYIMGNFQVAIIGDRRNYQKGRVIIDGSFEAIEYSIKYEKVVKSQRLNYVQIGKGAIVVSLFIFSAYIANKIGFFGGTSEL